MSFFAVESHLIYLVEIFVNKLILMKGAIEELDGHPIVVKIKLFDLPNICISQENFNSIKPTPIDESGTINVSMGKSCLFIKKPNDFVRKLPLENAKVDIFRLGDKYPTLQTELPFSGCFCNQSFAASDDTSNPLFLLSDNFPLRNVGEDLSGYLNLQLKLTCLGNRLSTCYEIHSKFSLFKNDNQESEFAIKELISNTEGVIDNGKQMLEKLRNELEQGKGTPVTKVKGKDKKGKKKKRN